jgi:hypothetical protein
MLRNSLLAVILAGSTSCLMGQRTTADIVGAVTDSTGSVITKAQITVINEGTGIKRDAVSNDSGNYSAPLLPPGNYRITVQSPGFHPVTRTGITLDVDETARIDFVLEVGAVSEKVEVVANASLVDTQTATLKEVIDQRRIQELPLNGRDPTQLILLLPGVYGTTADTSGLRQGSSAPSIVQPGISANGGRGNMVDYVLDGAPHNDTYTNVALAFPNPDALQEFSVQTNNFSAEFGRNAGAIVNAVTRSGTNTVHGSLFEFLRNSDTNARNFFFTTTDGLKRNQFGGTLGGPVFIPRLYNGHDRTFFFFSDQETRQVQTPSDNTVVVLTPAQRAGDFSGRAAIMDPLTNQPFAGNQIPLSRINPLSQTVMNKIIPLPNEPGGLFQFAVPNPNDQRQIVLKIDHLIGPKDTLSGRYLYNYYHQSAFNSPLVFAVTRSSSIPSHNVTVSETHIFSPVMVNQAQFSYNWRNAVSTPVWSTSFSSLGMQNVFTDPTGTPEFLLNITGAFSVDTHEGTFTAPSEYVASDTLRRTVGRHELVLGFQYAQQILHKNYRWLLDPYPAFAGNYSGYGVADFLLGLPSSLTENAYGEVGDAHMPNYTGFAQDNFRVNSRLTVNVGVRYEPFIPYTDDFGRVTQFSAGAHSQVFPNAPAGLLFPGDPGVSKSGTKSSLRDFAPRFGFAWSPFGDHKTSIRAGYGIFYDASTMSALKNAFEDVAPWGTQIVLQPPPGPFNNPFNGNNPFPLPFPPPKNITFLQGISAATFDPNFHPPYLQDWHTTIEHEIHRDWLLRVAYAGSKGTHLLQGWELNPSLYIPGKSDRTNTNARRLYGPAFTNIRNFSSVGNSTFNSLQITVEKRFSRSFTLLSSYTFAKSIDYGSGGGTQWPSFPDPYNFAQNRGLSDFNHAHRFVTSGMWQAPSLTDQPALVKGVLGGWSLSGVITLQTGAPINVLSGQDNSLSGVNADRPDLVGNPARSARSNPNADPVLQWFNTQAFVQNAIGTFGTTGRNALTGPGLADVDVALAKSIPLGWESTRLQFRAEAFNLANHANFNNPNATLTSGTYGRITTALDPRIMQFVLKLQF